MKKIVSLVCAVLMLFTAICLTACGGGGQDISGTYKLTEMTAGGEDMTAYLDLIGDVILTVEGSKATLTMDDDTSELTVDTAAQTMTSNGSSSPYTIDGNKLTLEDKSSDTKMVFEKQ